MTGSLFFPHNYNSDYFPYLYFPIVTPSGDVTVYVTDNHLTVQISSVQIRITEQPAPTISSTGGGGGVANLAILNCTIAGNSVASSNANDGINIAAGVSQFRIIGNKIGIAGPQSSVTQRYGVYITSGASNNFIITNNDFTPLGNTSGPIFDASSGTTKAISDNLGGPVSSKAIIAASAAISITQTIIVQIPVPPGAINPGTTYRATLWGTCTSTAANASTFRVLFGTNGTTADTVIGSGAVTAVTSGTAIPFKAEIEFTFRTIGATGSIYGFLGIRNTGVTGINANDSFNIALTVANANTTANNFLSFSYQSAAATTACTFQNAWIECVAA